VCNVNQWDISPRCRGSDEEISRKIKHHRNKRKQSNNKSQSTNKHPQRRPVYNHKCDEEKEKKEKANNHKCDEEKEKKEKAKIQGVIFESEKQDSSSNNAALIASK
jgi:DNA polymerase III alpha subunit (gram-positive type)